MNKINHLTHADYDMIVFCHLRWDFVYQRPQHIISRLAKNYKILVVEEPIHFNGDKNAYPNIREINSNLYILQPAIQNIDETGSYLKKILQKATFPIAWFYSAAFIEVLDILDFETVIYDCMDELSLFKGASEKLIEQERNLLSAADLVYTGGKSLFEAKKQKHHNVYCFPSSVEIDHFADVNNKVQTIPKDLENISAPIVGYYGVIDERIDLELIKKSAQLMPDVSFVMIGPICKIEEKDLPKADNIHYLGMKSYTELPHYLKYFDFAMMPFALNDSTKFISPTKTLEYMSAHKPIISTKIKDVERDYSDCINLIDNENDFQDVIRNPKKDYKKMYEQILEKTSWDKTAEKMNSLIVKIPV